MYSDDCERVKILTLYPFETSKNLSNKYRIFLKYKTIKHFQSISGMIHDHRGSTYQL